MVSCSYSGKGRNAGADAGSQGFRTHLPQIIKTVRHARQLRAVRAPLFPRYLSSSWNVGRDRWLSVSSTVGVSGLFMCDGRPVPVLVGVVETLIENTDEVNPAVWDAGLRTGQRVRVLSGPFADLVGTLERLDGMGRVSVLLDMMGRAVPVALYRSALAPTV